MYYYSDRHPVTPEPVKPKKVKKAKEAGRSSRKTLILVIALLIGGGWYFMSHRSNADEDSQTIASQSDSSNTAGGVAVAKPVNYCADNKLDKFIRISIEKRHLWACQGGKTAYDSAVITGLRGHPETETPVGTYKIYGKMTNTTLTGSDSRGTWKDPVYYWMPFLDNQYGTYGFHDATWRADSAFGNVSPDSEDASHGCVELPLASSKWLYNWAPVGTTVTVES